MEAYRLEGENTSFSTKLSKMVKRYMKMYGVNECMVFFDKKLWVV